MDPDQLDQFSSEKLTPSEEAVLALEISKGSEEALVKLVMANMHEAILYTRRCDTKVDERTRISLCYQELTMSARRFIPGRIRFFAFAKAGLRGRMMTYWKSLKVVRNASEIISSDELDKPPIHTKALHWVSIKRSKWYIQPTVRPPSPDDDHERSPREAVTGEIALPETDQIVIKDELALIKKTFYNRLSKQQWMILDLVYRGGLNFPEIGKLLGLTKAAVHISHKKAIEKLHAAVTQNKRLLL